MSVNSFSGQPAIPASYGFTAGKNKIINGDFGVWQRGTSIVSPANGNYTADRFYHSQDGTGTVTVSQQTFTPGTAPVAGYEGTYFFRQAVTATGTTTFFQSAQKIEDVRTFAGQTVTLSFWAKADSARTSLVYGDQLFGTGGSSTNQLAVNNFSLTTSWQRFSFVYTIPSISGKTIGTGSALAFYIRNGGTAVGSTIDIWGVQVEAGATATSFQTATGTIQGELAACQRYFAKSYPQINAPGTAGDAGGMIGFSITSTVNQQIYGNVKLPVAMRAQPTVTMYSFNGATGKISQVSNGADQAAASAYGIHIGWDSFNVQNNSGGTVATSSGAIVHYTASAEL